MDTFTTINVLGRYSTVYVMEYSFTKASVEFSGNYIKVNFGVYITVSPNYSGFGLPHLEVTSVFVYTPSGSVHLTTVKF